jgi:hypothetical protein
MMKCTQVEEVKDHEVKVNLVFQELMFLLCKQPAYTVKQHLKDSVNVPVHDAVIQELKHQLDTTGMKEIFSGLDAMNPKDTFASFNADHIMTFAEQYEGDFKLRISKVA